MVKYACIICKRQYRLDHVAVLVALAVAYPALDAALGLRLQLVAAGILLFVMLALGLNNASQESGAR